jgi:hypothetical protein
MISTSLALATKPARWAAASNRASLSAWEPLLRLPLLRTGEPTANANAEAALRPADLTLRLWAARGGVTFAGDGLAAMARGDLPGRVAQTPKPGLG